MFGDFNHFIDELGHVIFALPFTLTLYIADKVSLQHAAIIFLAAIVIDIDHILNPIIGKLFKFKGTIRPSKKHEGAAVKLFHGFDLFALYSYFTFQHTQNPYLSLGIFANLVMHHIWDFLTYDHSWKELFFITRVKKKFVPGRRKRLTGLVFNSESIPM